MYIDVKATMTAMNHAASVAIFSRTVRPKLC
jgi:hypothetical protein